MTVSARNLKTMPSMPFWRAALMGLAALTLASCGSMSKMGGLLSDSPSEPATEQQVAPPLPVEPSVPGAPAKVALLLPVSAPGETGQIATAMKQAAELALIDAGGSGVTLISKDTLGTAEGAAAAAQQALDEGAQLVIGPLLGSEVQAVAPIAQARNVPVVAFSSSSSVAGNGVYLMSFLPEEEVANIIRYASDNKLLKVAGLLPKSQYGAVVERALLQSAQTRGVTVAGIVRFPRTAQSLIDPARETVGVVNDSGRGVQALLIAESGPMLTSLGVVLKNAGYTPGKIKLLGTGLWDAADTRDIPLVQGGYYAGVAPELVKRFNDRYGQQYFGKPNRIASLAYDAVSLSIILARTDSKAPFTREALTNTEGFQGVNGLFRFRQNGLIERGLAILQVMPGGPPQVVAPAPERFTPGT
jgi:branched-chain amino acid transport system substrate-binding protein